MSTHVELRPGAYADSVTLLQVSRTVQDLPGVAAAQVAMATSLNVEVLTTMGFDVPADAGPNDLVVAVRLDGAELASALVAVDEALSAAASRQESRAELAPPRTTGSALRAAPGSLVLVSVPGASAAVEAMDALEAGCDVMIFSDHVPLEQEVVLKSYAAERRLLVMGPDCGTAVVDGVGLGFANVVEPGPVGIVAASGTGCQQVLALLDHAGVGVSSALGVGGRDLSSEVGGLATMEALRRLDEDPTVALVVLVSKPPDPAVAEQLTAYVETLGTPVELALLGPGRPDLTAATRAVLHRLHADPALLSDGSAGNPDRPVAYMRRVSGLYVGGTLCTEARIIVEEALGTEAGHELVDFGDDAYTAGRAHPMIDPTLRLEHLERAAADDEVGVLLLDVVLGHGAEPDPAARLAPVIARCDKPVVVTVVGTRHDPQGLDTQVAALTGAGAEVHLSNADAARRAVELVGP